MSSNNNENDTSEIYTILTEVEYFEGFVGALGTMISFFIFRQMFDLNNNMGIVLGLTFISTWLMRKIGMSVYFHMKEELKIKNKKLKLSEIFDLSNVSNPKQTYYIIVITFLLFIGIVSTLTAKKVISPINIVIFLMYCIGFLSLVHFSE